MSLCISSEDQMLVELKIVNNPERVGFYSGVIVSHRFVHPRYMLTILP